MNTPPPRESFWTRRVQRPLLALLAQGLTPDRIALTLGVGSACSLFPFLGFTALLNLGVGLALRLNQPLLQTLNQVLGPLQLLLILPYVRLGEWLWHAPAAARFTLTEMLATFRDAPFAEFLARFGWAGIHAFTAWALTAPVLALLIQQAVRPALRRLGTRQG